MHTPALGAVEVIEDALIRVGDDGTILGVDRPGGPDYDRVKGQAGANGTLTVLGHGQYLLPGLVDPHVHASQWPQMGKALHLPLYDWLAKCTFPLEARYADTAFAERVYTSLVDHLLANGTTTAMYLATVHLEATTRLADICLARGQRSLVGKVAMDDRDQCPDYYRDPSPAAGIDGTAALIDHVRSMPGNEDGLVRPVITPRFIPSCSDELLTGLGALAGSSQCHVQTHCSESDWEHRYVLERMGRTDTQSLNDFGLLTRGTVLAHSNFISDRDMDLIDGTGAGIAHCPLANYYFANSVFPLRDALDKGLHVGLGSDISGGASPSIFEACRYAVTASRALEDGVDPTHDAADRGRPGARIDWMDAFWVATAGGGVTLDLPVGIFAPGYLFDAMVIDATVADGNIILWDDIDTPEDVFQKIVYNAARNNIRKVWVHGRTVVDKDRGGDRP